jgi:putative membrane protein
MAILLGIYKDMMEIAANFISKPFKMLKPLIMTGAFCFSGALAFSLIPCRYAASHESAYIIASALIVAVSLPFYIKNSAIRKVSFKTLLYVFSGAASLTLIDIILNSGNVPANQSFDLFSYFLAGFVLSVSLILPGISFPYMLAFIGIYGNVMNAVNTFDMLVLLPLGFGIVLGVVMLSRSILKIMEKYTLETDCFLLGFTVSSVIAVFIH